MKKVTFLVVFLTLAALLLATTQAMAADPQAPKKTPDHTPGAKATERADDQPGQGQQHGKKANYKGIIGAVDAASLTLTLKDGSTVAFILTDETQVKIPTLGQEATIADLKVGMNASVHATKDEAGVLTASKIMVVPGKPALTHRVGTVTDYQPGVSITIEDKDGLLFTFVVTAETKVLPAERADQLIVGARVTIIAPRDVTGGDPTAKGIVVHPAAADE